MSEANSYSFAIQCVNDMDDDDYFHDHESFFDRYFSDYLDGYDGYNSGYSWVNVLVDDGHGIKKNIN